MGGRGCRHNQQMRRAPTLKTKSPSRGDGCGHWCHRWKSGGGGETSFEYLWQRSNALPVVSSQSRTMMFGGSFVDAHNASPRKNCGAGHRKNGIPERQEKTAFLSVKGNCISCHGDVHRVKCKLASTRSHTHAWQTCEHITATEIRNKNAFATRASTTAYRREMWALR